MSKVLVIGAARSGSEVSKLLIKKGYEVYLTDAKEIKNRAELEKLGIKIYENGHPHILKDLDYEFVVKNPGIRYDVPFVKYFVDRGDKILNEIEVANSYVNYEYGAITGTNGKTTTTTLLGEILKKKYGEDAYALGNIGTPLSTIVLQKEDKKCHISLEISAFQLNATPTFKPKVSVIMNLTPDHLDFYSTLDEYYDAKCLVYKNQDENDFFIRNIDDPEIEKRCTNLKCNVIDLSLKEKRDLYVENDKVFYKEVELFEKSDLFIVGEHNLMNAMVAACMGYILGVSPAQIKETIKEFRGVEHRIEFVRELNGVKYYNDSKGTNVDAGVVALKSFDKPVILLAGGHDKHTGFKEVIPYLDRVKHCFVFGETKDELSSIFKNAVKVEDMKEALEKANEVAESGDIVLLSPMCSSYDQFKNFEQRGQIFKDLVNAL